MIIGLIGPRGSGKTTAALHLQGHHGFERRSFATPLKAMLRALGLDERQLNGDLKTEPCDLLLGQTPAYAMQTLGTEWGRDLIGERFWVHLLQRSLIGVDYDVVIDDVRFFSEAEGIRELGGELWRLTGRRSTHEKHRSETELERISHDLTIDNAGSLERLYAQLDAQIAELEVEG